MFWTGEIVISICILTGAAKKESLLGYNFRQVFDIETSVTFDINIAERTIPDFNDEFDDEGFF